MNTVPNVEGVVVALCDVLITGLPAIPCPDGACTVQGWGRGPGEFDFCPGKTDQYDKDALGKGCI
jgi:hypothetical protein